MSEIITFGVGKTGIDLTTGFFKQINEEHAIQADATKEEIKVSAEDQYDAIDNSNVFYNEEQGSGKFTPRALLCDLDTQDIEKVGADESCRDLFRKENMLTAGTPGARLYGRGYYTDGPKIEETFMEALKKEAEKCDSLQ